MTQEIPAWVDGELKPVDKILVHVEGLKHRAVSVFVVAGNQVLIQKRAAGKYHTPGLWANTCCTHPHWGESAEDCAVRRLSEELGITGLTVRHCGTVEYRADVGSGMTEHEVVDIFCAKTPGELSVNPDPEEVESVRWIGLYDLAAEARRHPERFTPWLKIYLEKHIARIFGSQIPI